MLICALSVVGLFNLDIILEGFTLKVEISDGFVSVIVIFSIIYY